MKCRVFTNPLQFPELISRRRDNAPDFVSKSLLPKPSPSLVRRVRACLLRVVDKGAHGVVGASLVVRTCWLRPPLPRVACSVRGGCWLPFKVRRLHTHAWMASSAQRGTTRAPPPPAQLAFFYKLVDKKVIAGVLCRDARNAELSGQAAVQAEALFGDDSLVVAHLRRGEGVALFNMSCEANGAEEVALFKRSWGVLLSLIPLLLRRLEANTLLPGTITEVEMDFEIHMKAAMMKAMNEPVPPPAVLRAWASTMGYNTLLSAMLMSLEVLQLPLWPATQRRSVESFVLQGLDVIPRTAGIPASLITGEDDLVAFIETKVSPQHHGPAFCSAVLRKWRSDAVSNVLRARGVLQTGIAKRDQTKAEFDARQRADIAKHGLRDCALPSCAKTEKTVKEFAGCSGCRSVVYCCLEHQALDWRAHKKACREKEAARMAADGAKDEGTDGAAAA